MFFFDAIRIVQLQITSFMSAEATVLQLYMQDALLPGGRDVQAYFLLIPQVQSTFLALAEATVLRPYMREAVLEVSNACNVLKEKDCAPHLAVQAMLVLRTEVCHSSSY
jgi:hypothetical protein